jgi:hypothetical protein
MRNGTVGATLGTMPFPRTHVAPFLAIPEILAQRIHPRGTEQLR